MQDGITLQSLTVSIMVDGAFQCISIDPLLYLFQVYYTKYPFFAMPFVPLSFIV